jgi:hypothetical protein
MGLFDENTRGRKSCNTVPLKHFHEKSPYKFKNNVGNLQSAIKGLSAMRTGVYLLYYFKMEQLGKRNLENT